MGDEKPILARALVDVDTMVRAFKIHFGTWPLVRRLAIGVVGLFFILFGIRVLARGKEGFAIFLEIVGIFYVTWAALGGFQLRKSISKQLKQAGEERQEINDEICDTHLRLESKDGMSNIPWSKVRKWKERQGLVLLYRHDANFIVVPIEQFEPEVQEALRARLLAHVARI